MGCSVVHPWLALSSQGISLLRISVIFQANIPLSTSFILPAGPCAGGDHAKQLLFNPNRALLPSGRYNSETIQ